MGRTYKQDPNEDDFDDLALIDDMVDDDLLDWMTRPNAARSDIDGRPGRRPGVGRSSYRGLPDDWQDFDYGGDIWR